MHKARQKIKISEIAKGTKQLQIQKLADTCRDFIIYLTLSSLLQSGLSYLTETEIELYVGSTEATINLASLYVFN